MRFKSALLLIALIPTTALAQGGQRGAPEGPPPTARQQAPFDLTGYWVSIVTEDWRWRMVTPAKGDYASVPLNDEGRKTADGWDLTKDKATGVECKAFGAAAVMRLPIRVHITWQDDNTLKIETDAGQQTRLFHFGSTEAATGERQWQGFSKANWNKQPQSTGLGFGAAAGNRGGFAGGNLKAVTSNMRAGYLRKGAIARSLKKELGVQSEGTNHITSSIHRRLDRDAGPNRKHKSAASRSSSPLRFAAMDQAPDRDQTARLGYIPELLAGEGDRRNG